MPIKRSSILRELLREPQREPIGIWRAAAVFLPRSGGRPIRIPGEGSRLKAARRELGRCIAPRRLAS
jgi:hypothetical protein